MRSRPRRPPGDVPLGRVSVLGGRSVHWVRRPGARPSVVLLGGLGVPSFVWRAVADALPGVDLVALDRPGLMGTPWPRALPWLGDEVATLLALVEELGGPVVVVAHSMAGPHAEALARLHPSAVSGLVLVESSVEWDSRRPRWPQVQLWLADAVRASSAWSVVRHGGSLAGWLVMTSQSRGRLDPRTAERSRAAYRDRDAVASVVAENGAYGQQIWDLQQLRETCPFPDVPVVVLTAGDSRSGPVRDQARLAELLGGEQVMAEESRHMVMLDRPDLVAAAVRRVRSRSAEDGPGT